jgi:hypothetical protein
MNPEPAIIEAVTEDIPMKEQEVEETKIEEEQAVGLSLELVNKFESLSEKLI